MIQFFIDTKNKTADFIKKNPWHFILLLASSIYLFCNKNEIYQLTQLNTKSLIFLVWILLLLFPLFSEFEILGVKIKKEVEKATNEIKKTLETLQMQITTMQCENTNNNIFNLALWDEEFTNKILAVLKEKNKKEINADSTVMKNDSTRVVDNKNESDEKRQKFADIAFNIAYGLSKICSKLGHNPTGTEKTIKLLENLEVFSKDISSLIFQILEIAKRGMNGEILSEKYIELVHNAYPEILRLLENAENNLTTTACPRCKYIGYSVYGNVCPRCGFISDDD